jgi:Na+/melibiose symporter-like transporter
MVPITACIYNGLDAAQIAEGTTAQRIFQQIGGAVGTVVMAIMLGSAGSAGTGGLSGQHAYALVFGLSCVILAAMILPLVYMTKPRIAEVTHSLIDRVSDCGL